MNISRTDRQNKLTVKLTSNPPFNSKRKNDVGAAGKMMERSVGREEVMTPVSKW